MTNPFTRFLQQWSQNQDLETFVTHWDALEFLVVRVHRQKMSPDEARTEFERAWPWLRRHYPVWEAKLRPFWQKTKAGGRPTDRDPFLLLLSLGSPEEIPGNWELMQHLPAAREALNQLILAEK